MGPNEGYITLNTPPVWKTFDGMIDERTAEYRHWADAAYCKAIENEHRIDDLEKRTSQHNIDIAESIAYAVNYLLEELRNRPINTIDEDELSESIMALIVGAGGQVT